jgi:hypothetical protein
MQKETVMYKSNLILHSGAQAVELEQVLRVQTPPATATWQPIPHAELLDKVRGSLEGQGLSIVNESHGLNKEGQRYFGLLQVQNGRDSDDFGLVVGVRNSHDQSYPAGLVLGASVFVCDNLSFSGEVKLSRKHTRFISRDLPGLVDRAVGMLGSLRTTQEQRFGLYQQTEVSDREAHDLVIQALDAGVIRATKIPDVLEQWRRPAQPEFAKDGRTAWRLFNGFTSVLKGHLAILPRRTQALHGLMDSRCGLLVPQSYQAEDADIQVAQAL